MNRKLLSEACVSLVHELVPLTAICDSLLSGTNCCLWFMNWYLCAYEMLFTSLVKVDILALCHDHKCPILHLSVMYPRDKVPRLERPILFA